MKRFLKIPHVISVLAISGFVFTILNSNNQPLFTNLDTFILFAQKEVKLEKDVQISSGDIGSNKEINIEKDTIINGNLFADEIILDKNTQINSNVSFNKLQTQKDTQILGIQTKPIQLPIANLLEIPKFQIGIQDFKFEDQTNILSAGSYKDIVIEKNSRLILEGGVYNLRKLELKESSVLIFNAPTTLNIQFKLRGHNKVSILPGLNIKPDDLKINYLGLKPKKEKDEKEDDDNEIISEFDDDREQKDYKAGKIGRPVIFDKNSFLNFKLFAPKANIKISEVSIMRGQVLARKIKIGKETILSREEVFEKESDSEKIVEDEGIKFVVNEMVIIFKSGATISDLLAVADFVNGHATGFLPDLEIGKIEVPAETITELNNLIDSIKNSENPLIDKIVPNALIL